MGIPALDCASPEISPTIQLDPSKYTGGAEGGLRQEVSFRRHTSLILTLLVLVHVGWLMWLSAVAVPAIDFSTFWIVPHALSHNSIAKIYSLDGQRDLASAAVTEAQSPNISEFQRKATTMVTEAYDGRIEVTATPLLYTAIGWLSSGNAETDQKRFMFICMLSLVLSMLVFKNLLGFSLMEISLLTIFIAAYYGPVLSDTRVGNINEIQLLAIALFIFFMARTRPLLAGIVIGTATMLKPTLVMVLAASVIGGLADRDYRQLLRMLSGCLIATGASVLVSAGYFGNSAIWLDFLHSLPKTLNGVSIPQQKGNFSFTALVFGATGSRSAVIPLVLLIAFSLLLFTSRRKDATQAPNALSREIDGRRRMHTAFAVGGSGCAIMLLSSPLVWMHYYLLLLPLSLYLLRPIPERKTAPSGGIRVRGIAALALPFLPLFMFSFLAELMVGNNTRNICNLFVIATVSTLALASYRIWQERRALLVSNPIP